MKDKKDKVILSDYFLKREGYTQVAEMIKKNNFKKIVIVGGSHSGFAAAWTLLHGPVLYNCNNSIWSNKYKTFPDLKLKSN